jgi:hypothetical protein
VEHKFRDPFEFRPYATCWFGTNHLPHTRDFSDALFRRAMVVPFNRKFTPGVDADPRLKDKLIEELPGILNLALDAYARVIERGAFTEPQSCSAGEKGMATGGRPGRAVRRGLLRISGFRGSSCGPGGEGLRQKSADNPVHSEG